jgi:hypothetical protein
MGSVEVDVTVVVVGELSRNEDARTQIRTKIAPYETTNQYPLAIKESFINS